MNRERPLAQRTIAKVTRRLVPFLMLLYCVAYLDRVNIGFAGLTMAADIGLSDAAFGFGAGIFFLGYFLFEVPSNLILHRVGARRWIARIMISWGVISALMAFVTSTKGYYTLRFLLGLAEAGFFPGVILYLSYWFPARQRAGVTALFMAAVPLSTAIGSPISGGLLNFDGLFGLHGWQWLFLLEALPAVVLGGVALRFLTDRPRQAAWLAADERAWLVAAMEQEVSQVTVDPARHGLLQALLDPKIALLSLIYFGTSAGLYTLGIWAPKFIVHFGASNLATGFINAGPAVVALFAMIAWSRHSDATGERRFHVAIACLLAVAGLAWAAASQGLWSAACALVLANVGISAAKPPLWSLPTTFLTGAAAAAGIAAINAIGNLGGFLGPSLIGWLKSVTGGYAAGLLCIAGLLLLSAILVATMARPADTTPMESKT